ncbi:MAG: hypothetical protein AWT59_1965 [Candidatus Gallionella acididurans]|uniref:Uncharacterized protein n=1 Tax=Candidatus Gallionella acididurans TaxID=1796491 RepID=A0A139BSI8_9PROT|nr:MAG: hypothetical protein AWT59_1965 [Candidatus Gallionella acididurans]
MNEAASNSEVVALSNSSGKVKWIVGGMLLLFAAVIAMNLPRGYSDDLSRIGKGKVAVVLVRDKNAVQSFDLMEVMDAVRGKYDGQVEFLLTDSDTPEGRAFIADKGAARVTLVVLDGNGKTLDVLSPPQTAAGVQQAITVAIGAAS